MTLILSVVDSRWAIVGREAPSVQASIRLRQGYDATRAPEKLEGPSSKVIRMGSLERFSIKYSFTVCRLPACATGRSRFVRPGRSSCCGCSGDTAAVRNITGYHWIKVDKANLKNKSHPSSLHFRLHSVTARPASAEAACNRAGKMGSFEGCQFRFGVAATIQPGQSKSK